MNDELKRLNAEVDSAMIELFTAVRGHAKAQKAVLEAFKKRVAAELAEASCKQGDLDA